MSPLFASHQQGAPRLFRDRLDAGRRLTEALRPVVEVTPSDDIVAIGLARGGVVVAAEVARGLVVRLEAIVVRKLGAPGQPELAIGALTASGERVLNARLIDDLGIREMELDGITERARVAARQLCEEIGAPPSVPNISGKIALLIDDGLATGATMRAAVNSARQQGAREVIVAVPVAPLSSVETFRRIADNVISVLTPADLRSVGQWYELFLEVPSAEVRETLASFRE